MINETGTMKTEIIYSDDRQNRYLLRKSWSDNGERAMLFMTNASTADVVSLDMTTLYAIRNLNNSGFSSVDIVNICSKITTKLDIPKDVELEVDSENISQILRSAEQSDKIIIAWGRLGENNKKVRALQDKILERLIPFESKLYMICDDNGEVGFHPLAPQIRFVWHLVKFEIPKPQPPVEEAKQTKKAKNKKSQANASAELPVPEIKEDNKTEESA